MKAKLERSSRRHKPRSRRRRARPPRSIPIPPFPPPLQGMSYRSDCSKVQTPGDQCPTVGQALQLHRLRGRYTRKDHQTPPLPEDLLDLDKAKEWFLACIAPKEPEIYSLVLGRAVPPAALPLAEFADPTVQQQLQALCPGPGRSH